MNRLEQQIRDAAPEVRPATFPIDTRIDLSPSRLDEVQTLGPGTLPLDRGSWRRLVHIVLLFVVLVAGGSWGLATITAAPVGPPGKVAAANPPPTSGESEAAKSASSLPGPESGSWRTATMVTPWADKSTSVEARIDLPAEWRVQRHEASAEYPGLHVTILDENYAPVAMLYFGPAASSEPCPLRSAAWPVLEWADVTTGAELLDPALAASFSFGVSTGAEPRAVFGLVSTSISELGCKADARNTGASSPLILRLGDVLGLDAATRSDPAPKSSYARTFSSVEEALRYLHSQEFNTLKRLITSLKFSFPQDRSGLWRVPAPGAAWPRD